MSVSVRIIPTQALPGWFKQGRQASVFERDTFHCHLRNASGRQEYLVHPSAIETSYNVLPLCAGELANEWKFVGRVGHDASPEMVDCCAAVFPAFEVALHVAVEVCTYFGEKRRVVPVVVPRIAIVRERPLSAAYDYAAVWSGV